MDHASKFTIPANQSIATKGSMTFRIRDEVEQLQIDFQVSHTAWIQIFIKKDGKCIGESLLTHQQAERIILIGKENLLTSSTITPQESLLGKWEIIYIAKPHFPESCNVVLAVRGDQQGIIDTESEIDIFNERHQDKKGWLKGDFHTHTHLSDGEMSRTENLVSAKNQNLDFFFTTEHNVIVKRWPKNDEVMVFPGVELTSDIWGHCNYLGVTRNLFSEQEYEKMTEEIGIREIIRQNQDNGILSINHPYLEPWEWNTDIPVKMITSLEVMNDPTYQDNTKATEKAFDLWSRMWNKGLKITGIGGSDSHLRPDKFYPGANSPSLIGDPGTYVYVDGLNEQNVLEAVKNGSTKVSRIGEIHLKSQDHPYVLPGEKIQSFVKQFEIQLPYNAEDYQVEWIFDGRVIKTEFTADRSEVQLGEVDHHFHWLRADVRKDDEIVATFNPVYWNDKKPEITMLKEIL